MNRCQAFSSKNHLFSSLKRVEDRLVSEGKEVREKKRRDAPFSFQSQDLSEVPEVSVLEKRQKNTVINSLTKHLDHPMEQANSPHFPGYDRSINLVSATGSTGTSKSQNVFFSSVKQVEDRLASEDKGEKTLKRSVPKNSLESQNILNAKDISTPEKRKEDDNKGTLCTQPSHHLVEQFSSSLCIVVNQATNMVSGSATPNQDSKPPWEFISHPHAFSDDSNLCRSVPIGLGEGGYFKKNKRCEEDINHLMDLLGLLAVSNKAGDDDCLCSGGSFYSRIVGVKGPKCGQERRRLDGWIEYYHKQNSEPARLAHLLLAKAMCMCEENSNSSSGIDDLGFTGIGFPSTVQEYLKHDPPQHISS